MYEIKYVRQMVDEPMCRWFMNTYFDLYVWYTDDVDIYGFQLCYDTNGDQRALTWLASSGYSHLKVDEIRSYCRMGTPILSQKCIFSKDDMLHRFKNDSKDLETNIVEFIIQKIECYVK